MTRDPCLLHARLRPDELVSLGDPLLDRYVAFVASRCRPNTVRATVSDLRAFFAVIDKPALEVTTADVFAFIAAQREPKPGRANVVRLGDGGQRLSSRTIQRRLATMSGFFGHLVMLDELAVNPVPRLFVAFLAEEHPDVHTFAEVRRPHIEDFKTWLRQRRAPRGGTLTANTIRQPARDAPSVLRSDHRVGLG